MKIAKLVLVLVLVAFVALFAFINSASAGIEVVERQGFVAGSKAGNLQFTVYKTDYGCLVQFVKVDRDLFRIPDEFMFTVRTVEGMPIEFETLPLRGDLEFGGTLVCRDGRLQ